MRRTPLPSREYDEELWQKTASSVQELHRQLERYRVELLGKLTDVHTHLLAEVNANRLQLQVVDNVRAQLEASAGVATEVLSASPNRVPLEYLLVKLRGLRKVSLKLLEEVILERWPHTHNAVYWRLWVRRPARSGAAMDATGPRRGVAWRLSPRGGAVFVSRYPRAPECPLEHRRV